MLIARNLLVVSASLAILFCNVLSADEWPTFRGLNRTAVSPDTGLLQRWPTGGPPLVWKAEGAGRGYSSLAIKNGRIFTLGDGTAPDDADEYLLAYDEATGKEVWKHKTGDAWKSGQANWQSSRGTPSTDGEMVYVVTPFGNLVACKCSNGDEVWRKDFKADFDGKKGDGWGFSESPLIDGNKLLCTPGGEEATVVALDKRMGKLIWKASQPGCIGASHVSIVISEVAGQRIYVQLTASGAIGIRASDGTVLWNYPIEKTTAVAPTPIIKDDLVFIAAGYGRGGALLKQVPGADGRIDIQEVYGMKPDLANKHGGVVRLGDYIYSDSDDKGIPHCANLMTGEVLWKGRGSGKNSAAFAAADGHLYIHFADGTMVLANANPKEYTEVGSFQVPGTGDRPSWSHPVIVDGKLFLRETNAIYCYNIRASK